MDSLQEDVKIIQGKSEELSNLRGKFALSTKFDSVGLLTVYLVCKIQFRLSLCFELFDVENFRFGSQKLHLAAKSNLGSLL